MAQGDLIAAEIESDGFTLALTFEGMVTGGSYGGFGFDNQGRNAVNGPWIWVRVISLGFDPSGNATTITRDLRATAWKPQVTPNENVADETTVGSNVKVRVILEDCVYAKDTTGAGNSGTAPVVNISTDGAYTNGGTFSKSANSFPVTNNSTVPYFPVIGNWAMPGFQLAQGSTLRLRAVAFHRHPQNNRPVNFVRFTLTDGTNTVTKDVYHMTIDPTAGDKIPTAEYIADMSLGTLTQGAELTANFKAYPFVGDTASIRDSSAGPADPTPLCGPKKFVCDRLGTYGVTMALVDSTSGNDTTGQVYDSASYNAGTAAAYATIGKAASAIAAYNNTNRARNDVGGGIIELKAGNHAWLGSTNTYGNVPKCWITIRPAPGVTRAQAVIATTTAAADISDRIKLQGITITTTTVNTFTNVNAMWLDDCDMNSTSAGLFNTTGGVNWWTRGKVTAMTQGFRPASTANCVWALVRGADLPSFTRTILVYTVMGCHKYNRVTPSSVLFTTEYAGMTAPNPSAQGNFILYNCVATGLETPAVQLETGTQYPNQYGGAFVQVLLETCGTQANALADICSSDGVTTNTPLRNIILWHNSWMGNRCFIGYNDAGTLYKERYYWSMIGCYFDRSATKGDTHPPADPIRKGNWWNRFGCAHYGNHHEQCMISGASFFFRWQGISSFQPAPGNTGTAANPQFIDRKSATEVAGSLVAGPGNGDYRVPVSSPLVGRTLISPIPFDLDGRRRTAKDNAGTYALRKTTLGRSLAFAG